MIFLSNVFDKFVKNSNDLLRCDALIIPGGESTTMSLLINKYSLFNDLFLLSNKCTHWFNIRVSMVIAST